MAATLRAPPFADDTPGEEPRPVFGRILTSPHGGRWIPLEGDSACTEGGYARSVTRRQLLTDAAIAAGVLVLTLVILASGGARDSESDFRGLDALGVAL